MQLPLLNSEGVIRWVDGQDILYLQTDGSGDVTLFAYDETYKAISTVKELFRLLEPAGFVRVDRGTVVNPSRIDSFDPLLNVARIRTSESIILISVPERMLGILKLFGTGGE
ncbi:LytTR family DNA-binding domain-containing protein [Cohnella lupini]|uniref:LytTr DNA-binding domain-containing protein n=1 Tax=Cohnella lupini TaxID=1294267 RepID=A0A3D9IAE4_9BACL|nr:LytTR family DNA-binding domain-containing protein [Cohnella lupini]RED58615.1 LytTr DNA-binding domain-containing protein [Cohnella lupini]